eukprot:11193389-Lingulodinium_polyedra.AAC.1
MLAITPPDPRGKCDGRRRNAFTKRASRTRRWESSFLPTQLAPDAEDIGEQTEALGSRAEVEANLRI